MEYIYVGGIITSMAQREIVSETISKISQIFSSIISFDSNFINQKLQDIDIACTIQVLEALITEIPQCTKQNSSINLCIQNIKKSIIDIHDELKVIEIDLNYHKTKYLCNWRTPSSNYRISKLSAHTDLLNRRIDILVKVLSIKNLRTCDC